MVQALFRSITVALVLLVNIILASSTRVLSKYAVKERHHVPRGWSRVGHAPLEHLLWVQIGLKQSRFEELERRLYEVSDPSQALYGQHLSADEVNGLVSPANDTLDLVEDWLRGHDVSLERISYSPAKDWMNLALTVESVEHLLKTKYSVFKHEDGMHLIRTPQWSLPQHLHEHIQTIQPTNSFFQPRTRARTFVTVPNDDGFQDLVDLNEGPGVPHPLQACNATAITPQCLRTLYGTIDYKPQSATKNHIALTNYLNETNNHSDISLFLHRFRPDAALAAYNFTVQSVANGTVQQSPNDAKGLAAGTGIEGNLDAETVLSITWPTPLTAYSTGGSPPFIPDDLTPVNNTNEPYLTWLQWILAQDDIPQVISTSYGDDEQTVPYSYAVAVCNGFAQLGARGVSVIFASGDNGVGRNGDCFANDGRNTSAFLPGFPAGCPYVTTIGATRSISPEIAAHDPGNNFTSGGGFSNYFSRPSYQNDVIPAYIDGLKGQFDGLYNKSGRAYPDFAAQGYRYLVVWNGTVVRVDGTSAATPTAASIISLLNDALLAAGKPVLGFLNPWLYSTGFKEFTDVTEGSAIGCNTSGFPATKGWDAVTGFGTPYFPKLHAAVIDNAASSTSRPDTVTYMLFGTLVAVVLMAV